MGLLDWFQGNPLINQIAQSGRRNREIIGTLLDRDLPQAERQALLSEMSQSKMASPFMGFGVGNIKVINSMPEILKNVVPRPYKEAVPPRSGHVYRFLTGSEMEDAFETGLLKGGPNSAGVVNFSTEPIPVYGASAWKRPGVLIEMPEQALMDARWHPGSKDAVAQSNVPIPLKSASRVFAIQFPGGGMKAVDITDTIGRQ